MITDSFDASEKELISALDGVSRKALEAAKKYQIRTFIITFSKKLIDHLCETGQIELLDEDLYFGSAAGKNPVYRIPDTETGVFLSGIGAMMSAAMIEELSEAFQCRNYIFYGSCGVLTEIPEGKLIIPIEAYRDEGVSYHYAQASDYIRMKNASVLEKIFDQAGVGYVTGKTWTTDAFYRETERNRDRRSEEGCICVEMECSAVQAVCDFRGLELYHFLYGADSLKGSWQRRILGDPEMDSRIAFFSLAKMIAEHI